MYGIVAAVVALVEVQLKLKHNKTYMSDLSIKTRGNELLSICFSSSFILWEIVFGMSWETFKIN